MNAQQLIEEKRRTIDMVDMWLQMNKGHAIEDQLRETILIVRERIAEMEKSLTEKQMIS